MGFSAGGWIVQNLFYSNTQDIARGGGGWDKLKPKTKKPYTLSPYLPRRPLHADVSSRVQAACSDWGAAKLVNRQRVKKNGESGFQYSPHVRLSVDDPPLFTCYSGEPHDISQTSVGYLQALGNGSEAVFLG